MKKTFKTISVLLIAMLFSINTIAFAADASVTYKGNAERFETLPGSDLFGGFKNVMPGDELTEKITIQNDFKGADQVDIYLKAVPHGTENPLSAEVAANEDIASMNDFLHQLTLTVKQDGKVLSQDTAEKPASLEEAVLVGSFRGKGSSEITVTLSVPIEMGNEYADRMGEIDWVFQANEINDPPVSPEGPDAPNNPHTPSAPSTGDNSNIGFYVLLLLVSAIALVVLIKKHKS